MSTSVTPMPTRGVPLTLNGTTYWLRYSMKRLRQIRENVGPEVLRDGVTDERLVTVLWYGLGAEESPVSEEAIADAVDLENMGEVVSALQKAMGMAPVHPQEPLLAPAAVDTPAAAP